MAERHPVAVLILDLLSRRHENQATLGVRVAELEGRGGVYTQPTVSGWLDNIDRQAPGRIFLIEQALGQKPGSISRRLGYLPLEARAVKSVADALAADAGLSDLARGMLLAAYEQAIRDS